MTSAQLILVAVTSALVAVTAMLIVATIRRARTRDEAKDQTGSNETTRSNEGTDGGV